MGKPLRLLVVEDSQRDADLVVRVLERSGYDVSYRRLETEDELRRALAEQPWDVVVSDYNLPAFDAPAALAVVRESGDDIPFIIVSGSVGEETAVAALKAGAHDFFLKDRLALLGSAVDREMREAAVRRERGLAQRALQESEEQLRQAVRARDEFLSIASHELKTPLTPLSLHVTRALSLARELRSAPSDAAARKLESKLEMAGQSVERLTSLVDTLLDVTRITSGQFTTSPAELDLAEVVRDALGRWRDAFARAGAPLSLDTDGAVVGRWDRTAVETILNNLLSNALKFGQGKPVEVSLLRRPDGARLVVADHGVGIPPADRSRIFQRFERAVPSAHYGGFGIGLWVVRQIVEVLGGSIQVESEEGAGSTFTIELPAAPACAASSAA